MKDFSSVSVPQAVILTKIRNPRTTSGDVQQEVVVSRMDSSPIQESDKQRFNEALKVVSIRYPDFDLQELCRS